MQGLNQSLNPCCNGIYSMSLAIDIRIFDKSLNPCCNGIYSMSLCKNLRHSFRWREFNQQVQIYLICS